MKIFIIEDDPTISRELKSFLSKYGYECFDSNDFENIIEIVLHSKSNLILLDLNLPYQDGFHVCREIRKQSPVPMQKHTNRRIAKLKHWS
ncbi:response regulator [Clostridium estertheticum]|uniref:response regulator n=1 Tax=Clostridium estertheticum TaxID=238834 RepID=UPI001CCEC509|nr:response regulator [Clostridium estertheticum]MBZ9606569.1 response regulator [Clostridium estertheticum]